MVFLAETQLPDILQNLPKSWFRGPAHGSISIQEGQPISGGYPHLFQQDQDLPNQEIELTSPALVVEVLRSGSKLLLCK